MILLLGFLIAALVALGVFVYVQGGSTQTPEQVLQAPTTPPTRRVVVAAVDIPNNTLLTDINTLFTFAEISEADFNANPGDFFTSPAELTSKVTVRAVSATTPIRASDVTDAGLSNQVPPGQEGQPRTKAISVLVNNLTGVADEISPNDFVDILASFTINRTFIRPGFDETGNIRFVEEQFAGQSTKTLIQNVQVLRIKRPAPPTEGTPTPAAAAGDQPPAPDQGGATSTDGVQTSNGGVNAVDTLQPGTWTLVLAMTDQQAELLKFARETGNGITLVLRGRGDTATETTLGATLDILVANFGLPLPNPAVPAVQQQSALTPVPTTPAATPAPTASP